MITAKEARKLYLESIERDIKDYARVGYSHINFYVTLTDEDVKYFESLGYKVKNVKAAVSGLFARVVEPEPGVISW